MNQPIPSAPLLQTILPSCYSIACLSDVSAQERLRMIVETIATSQKPEDSIFVFARHRDADEFCLVADSQSTFSPESRDSTSNNDLFNWEKIYVNELIEPIVGSGVFYKAIQGDDEWSRFSERFSQHTCQSSSDFRRKYVDHYRKYNQESPNSKSNIQLVTVIVYIGTPVDKAPSGARPNRSLRSVLSPLGMIFVNLPRPINATSSITEPRSIGIYAGFLIVLSSLIEAATREAIEAMDPRPIIRSQESISQILDGHYSNGRSGGSQDGRSQITRSVISELMQCLQTATSNQSYYCSIYVVSGQYTIQQYYFEGEKRQLTSRESVVNEGEDKALFSTLTDGKCITELKERDGDRKFELVPVRILMPLVHDQHIRGVVEIFLDRSPRFLGWTIFQWLPLFDHCRSGLVQARRRLQRENLILFSSFWLERDSNINGVDQDDDDGSLVNTNEFASQLIQLMKALGASQVQVFLDNGDAGMKGWKVIEEMSNGRTRLKQQSAERIRNGKNPAEQNTKITKGGLTQLLMDRAKIHKTPIIILQHNIIENTESESNIVNSECFLFSESMAGFEDFDNVAKSEITSFYEKKVFRLRVGKSVSFRDAIYNTDPNPAISDKNHGGKDHSHSRIGLAIHTQEGGVLFEQPIVLWISFDGICDFTWSEQNLTHIASKYLWRTLKRSTIEKADALLGHEIRQEITNLLSRRNSDGAVDIRFTHIVDKLDIVNFILRMSGPKGTTNDLRSAAKRLMISGVNMESVHQTALRLLPTKAVDWRRRTTLPKGQPSIVGRHLESDWLPEFKFLAPRNLDNASLLPRGFRVVLPELFRNISKHAYGCRKICLKIDLDAQSNLYYLRIFNSKGDSKVPVSQEDVWGGGLGLSFLKQIVIFSEGALERIENCNINLLSNIDNIEEILKFFEPQNQNKEPLFCVSIKLKYKN
jgi:hypothetical protein